MTQIVKKIAVTSLIVLMCQLLAFSQSPDKITIDKQYYGNLDQVLDRISLEKGILFTYNKKKLAQIQIDDNTVNQPLDKLLDKWCLISKMEWYRNSDGIINIVGLNRTPGSEAAKTEAVKTYSGAPKAFNILISGKIVDSDTGEAVPYASVVVAGTGRGTQTNQDGYYTLQNVPTDTTTVLVSSIGYKPGYIFLTPDLSKSKLDVQIEPSSIEMKEIEVKAQRNTVMKTNDKISTIQITPRKLAELPNIGEKDILRVFQLMPGVSAANEGTSGLFVRGGTPDQNLILYDGFTVYHVDHLYGFFSAFNSNAVKDVQLYKGGFESKYAGRLSSVTDITGKDGNSKDFNIGGDLSLLSANVYAELPVGDKFTSLFAFRKSYKGPIYNKIFDQFTADKPTAVQQPGFGGRGMSNNFTSQVSSYFYDLNTKLTYRPTDKDVVSFSLFNGTDNLDNSVKVEVPSSGGGFGRSLGSDNSDLTEYGNLGASLKWSRKWNEKLYGNSLVSYSNFYSNRDRSSNRTTTDADGVETVVKIGTLENNDLKDFTFRSDYTWDVSSKNQIGFGLKATNYDIDYTYSQNDTATILNITNKGNLMGGYLQNKFKFFDNKLTITPGVHTTFYDVTNKFYAEPRLSATYNFNDKIKLVGAWGHYYQFANRIIREDILAGSSDFWILSDDQKVPVSKAIHYITGVNYETPDYLFSVEAYYKQLTGLSEYSLRFEPARRMQTINYEQNFFTGKGFARGIEFLAQKKFGNLTGWASYTLAQARNQFDVYGSDYFPAAQDVTNEFKAIGIYKWRKWSLAATWIYATGRPYTAPEGGYNITLLDGTEKSFITAGTKNSRRLPDYSRLDFSVNYLLKSVDQKTERGNISFSLFNVYDRKNTWYKEYQIIDSEIISIDKQFLGITPNLTVTLKLK
ncbi:MAG: TonB-dependent receptor [Bacteroidota bacterium]|nr:TonB-dependent receptor [Bacteroidota bacterium]